jgi:hypothetical protein
MAAQDRSWLVRDRACALLAYSLRQDALTPLSALLDDPQAEVRHSAQAARTAIAAQNHHLFKDRDGTGSVFWVVNPDDHDEPRPTGFLRRILSRLRGRKG